MRVLVVDDSVVMRRVIARTLERHPSIARTDFAVDGAAALAKLAKHRPDVVVLDLEMPVLDGFATLKEIRRTDVALPVVLFSSMDERVAADTLDALSVGATDFVVKPRAGGVAEAEAYVEEQLTPRVLALAGPCALRGMEPVPRTAGERHERHRVDAAVIAASTGGPDALSTLVRTLPAGLAVPVLVVQHMPPMFTRLLAERLDRIANLSVREAQDGDDVLPGTVFVAPGNRHLGITRTAGRVRIELGDGPTENSCRPAADVLFRAAVEVYGGRTLAVVLTGMGQDGLRGCDVVRQAGGQVIVQDPSTALIASMPGSVAAAGLAHAVVPLDLMADELVRRVDGTVRR